MPPVGAAPYPYGAPPQGQPPQPYPPQASTPAYAYPPQSGYAPQPGYPPQHGYPQQAYPPQPGYAPQPGYPSQPGYAPQGAYSSPQLPAQATPAAPSPVAPYSTAAVVGSAPLSHPADPSHYAPGGLGGNVPPLTHAATVADIPASDLSLAKSRIPPSLATIQMESAAEVYVDNKGFELTALRGPSSSLPIAELKRKLQLGNPFKVYKEKDKKAHDRRLFLDEKGQQLLVKDYESIDLYDIHEVRFGQKTSVWNTVPLSAAEKAAMEPLCFSICYGFQKTLDILAPYEQDFELWTAGIVRLANEVKEQDSESAFIQREWARMKKDSLNEKEILTLLDLINIHADKKNVRELLARVDDNKNGKLDLSEFVTLVRLLKERPLVKTLFMKYSADKQFLSADELLQFIHVEQQERHVPVSFCKEVISFFSDTPGKRGLSLWDFHRFIASPMNSAFNPGCHTVYQDMTQPLAHYWINSSHNTYLEGDQLQGRSSTDQYIRVLKSGCRCVELDCWDGDGGEPIIFHGHTLTSKITFRDVCKAIKEHAFAVSEFPVILSLEMHCASAGQTRLAAIMEEVFGSMLAAPFLDTKATQLPSPAALKGKILVKGKTCAAPSFAPGHSEQGTPEVLSKQTLLKTVKFSNFVLSDNFYPWEMCSFEETSIPALDANGMVRYNTHLISRSYPKGTRVSSDNYDPIPFWNVGMQLVALNFQALTDRAMWLNKAKFSDNGNSGYILKPAYMRDRHTPFDPLRIGSVQAGSTVQKLTVYVYDARQLPHSEKGTKKDQDVIDPYVVLEMSGCPHDAKTDKTNVIMDNGFNPEWKTVHEFHLIASELAILSFKVMDKDTFGADGLVAHAELPVECIRSGYRTVQLYTPSGKHISGCNLFCRFVING